MPGIRISRCPLCGEADPAVSPDIDALLWRCGACGGRFTAEVLSQIRIRDTQPMPPLTYVCGSCPSIVYTGTDDRIRNASDGTLHSCLPPGFTRTQYPPDPQEADIPFDEPEQAPTFATWRERVEVILNNPLDQEEGAPNLPEIQPDQWWSPPLPDGFTWYSYPTADAPGVIATDPRRETYPQSMEAILAWADEHNFVLGVQRTMEVYNGFQYVSWPQRLHVSNQTLEEYDAWAVVNIGARRRMIQRAIECPICESTHAPYSVRCPETGLTLACVDCGREMWNVERGARFFRSSLDITELPEGVHPCGVVCSNCGHPCEVEECEAVTTRGFDLCNEHGQHAECEACGARLEAPIDAEEPWQTTEAYAAVCDPCADACCPYCGRHSEHPLTFSVDLDGYVCRRCFREALAGTGMEEFDSRANMTARTMRIPTIPGRETIRDCGVEIEGGTGTGTGNALAQELFEAGLSTVGEMAGYHYGTRGGFAHVERDSSVDWELVIGPLNPAVREDVVKFGRVIRTLRSMVRDEVLKLDLRAGCHVHVGAERVSLDSAFNLNTIFAYAEDVIFRLGAAKWPIHRAIQDSHYTAPVPKATRKLQFAQMTGEEGSRYYALSFSNYFTQMMNACRCGAVRYDSWEDCECNLGKCTFEFRVFNTTANPRKLHAYLALCQAMVAKAISMGKVSNPADEFPALTFVSKRFKDMTEAEQALLIDEWQERLAWMFTELPLTDDERESLRYCVINSELVNVGDDFINNLIPAAEAQAVEEVAA